MFDKSLAILHAAMLAVYMLSVQQIETTTFFPHLFSPIFLLLWLKTHTIKIQMFGLKVG